jgi:hypothetical protein
MVVKRMKIKLGYIVDYIIDSCYEFNIFNIKNI